MRDSLNLFNPPLQTDNVPKGTTVEGWGVPFVHIATSATKVDLSNILFVGPVLWIFAHSNDFLGFIEAVGVLLIDFLSHTLCLFPKLIVLPQEMTVAECWPDRPPGQAEGLDGSRADPPLHLPGRATLALPLEVTSMPVRTTWHATYPEAASQLQWPIDTTVQAVGSPGASTRDGPLPGTGEGPATCDQPQQAEAVEEPHQDQQEAVPKMTRWLPLLLIYFVCFCGETTAVSLPRKE